MSIPSWILWFQTGYACWQFFRVASFLRLPYIFTSSLWHQGLGRTLLKKREVFYLVDRDLYTQPPPLQNATMVAESGEVVTYTINGSRHRYVGCHSSSLNTYLNHSDPILEEKSMELLPDVFIIREGSFDNLVLSVTSRNKSIRLKEVYCIIDQSSGYQLNENFMRVVSIAPLVAQARQLNVISVILSSTIILLDLFTYPSNFVWQRFKWSFQTAVKLSISVIPERPRITLHTLLSGASQNFRYCDTSTHKTRIAYLDYAFIVGKPKVEYFEIIPFEEISKQMPYPMRGEFTYQMNEDAISLVYSKAMPDDPADPFVDITWSCRGLVGKLLGVGYETLCKWDTMLSKCSESGVPLLKGLAKWSAHCLDVIEALEGQDFAFNAVRVDRTVVLSDYSLEGFGNN